MTNTEVIKHLDEAIALAQTEGATKTVDYLLDLRNLLKPQTNN